MYITLISYAVFTRYLDERHPGLRQEQEQVYNGSCFRHKHAEPRHQTAGCHAFDPNTTIVSFVVYRA